MTRCVANNYDVEVGLWAGRGAEGHAGRRWGCGPVARRWGLGAGSRAGRNGVGGQTGSPRKEARGEGGGGECKHASWIQTPERGLRQAGWFVSMYALRSVLHIYGEPFPRLSRPHLRLPHTHARTRCPACPCLPAAVYLGMPAAKLHPSALTPTSRPPPLPYPCHGPATGGLAGWAAGLLAQLARLVQPVAGAVHVRTAGRRRLARRQRVAHLHVRGAVARPRVAHAGLGVGHGGRHRARDGMRDGAAVPSGPSGHASGQSQTTCSSPPTMLLPCRRVCVACSESVATLKWGSWLPCAGLPARLWSIPMLPCCVRAAATKPVGSEGLQRPGPHTLPPRASHSR